jgi:iron complex transport system substrate-binding protein
MIRKTSLFALALLASLAAAKAEDTSKLVTLGGSVTEAVVELGALDQLVAIDLSSVYPMDKLAKLPKVGYYRQIGAEGILSTGATAVITTSEAGPKEALDQIKAAGIPVHVIPEKKTLAGAREKIVAIAEVLGKQEQAKPVLEKFDASLAEARAIAEKATAGDAKKPKVLFVMNTSGTGAFNVAGSGSGPAEMIREAGGENVAAAINGFQPMSTEAVAAAAPDVVLVPVGHGPNAQSVEAIAALPALADSPAVKNGRVKGVDLTLIAGFGPRCAEGLKGLATILHGGEAPAGH